jgi:hypothetical protein
MRNGTLSEPYFPRDRANRNCRQWTMLTTASRSTAIESLARNLPTKRLHLADGTSSSEATSATSAIVLAQSNSRHHGLAAEAGQGSTCTHVAIVGTHVAKTGVITEISRAKIAAKISGVAPKRQARSLNY